MSKRILFRLHGKHAQQIAEECKVFIKDYFSLTYDRVRLSIEPFPNPELLKEDSPWPYDLFIHTASDEAENIAHAAGWSYLKGIQSLKPLYTAGSTTFHDNKYLAEALKGASIHFEGRP